MMPGIPFGNFWFQKKRPPFYIFDLGGFSIKALLVDYAKNDELVVRAVAEAAYGSGDKETDVLLPMSDIEEACVAAVAQLKKNSPRIAQSAKQAVVGLPGSIVFGKNHTQFYARENPHVEIDISELKHVVQNLEQGAYEIMRKDFARETGGTERGAFIINAAIQEMKIDGYRVTNPLNFQGKEISVSVFNAYISRQHLYFFQELFSRLKLVVESFVHEPLALHQIFLQTVGSDYDAILLDVGGVSTTVTVVRKGRIEQTAALAIGSQTFAGKIACELEVGLREAEQIKMRFSEGALSENVAKKLARMIQNETSLFLRGLELLLRDFSQTNLLPTVIYVYGGGSLFSHVLRALRKKEWRESLSFLRPPRILTVEHAQFPVRIEAGGFIPDARWINSFALVFFKSAERSRREDIVFNTLKRMVKLIQ